MRTVNKKKTRKTLGWGLKKFGRWFRHYRRLVRLTKKEIGGGLQAIV